MSDEQELIDLRTRLQMSQSKMAARMGLPLRTYEDIERGRSIYREIHTKAASFAAMQIVADFDDLAEELPAYLWPLVQNLFHVGRAHGLVERDIT
jgi:DNA-binding XRE family transcriptional regulator